MFSLKNLARTVAVAVAGLGAAAALALPASAATHNVTPPVPGLGIHHPYPGLGYPGYYPGYPGIGYPGYGIGGCGTGCGGVGIGIGGCSSCGDGLGSPIYVGQVPWYGISSASLCSLGCGGVNISTLPSIVYYNGLTGVCAYTAGGAPIPSLYGVGRSRLGLGRPGLVHKW